MIVYACFEFPKIPTRGGFITKIRTKFFGHCYVIVPLTEDKCLILDKTVEGFRIKPFEVNALDLANNLLNNGLHVYKVNTKREVNKSFELFTCTGFVKKVLNVKAFWILTPRQLQRYLNERTRI